jgi:hypothetical protein
LDPERGRGRGIGVDVELRQDPLAVGLAGQLLEHGTESATRRAPGRPEVDHYGDLERPLDDFFLEIRVVNLDHIRRHVISNSASRSALPAILPTARRRRS